MFLNFFVVPPPTRAFLLSPFFVTEIPIDFMMLLSVLLRFFRAPRNSFPAKMSTGGTECSKKPEVFQTSKVSLTADADVAVLGFFHT